MDDRGKCLSALKTARDEPFATFDSVRFYPVIEQALDFAIAYIEAEPVRHGRWVDHMVRDWRCSECGKKVPRQVYFDGYCFDDKLNFCPNCGADMRKGESG